MDFILSALNFVWVLFLVIVVFNLMILVHEWGHFLAARWRGLRIDKFQIWFGKPLWKKTVNGVQYGLGSIPAGGFVALPQMAPMEALEGTSENKEPLPPISPMDKIIVAFAGPLFSFSLACLFAVLVWAVGGFPDRHLRTTLIGWVDETMPAAAAGLRPGDRILEIDGTPIDVWDGPIDSVMERIAFSHDEKITFLVQRAGEKEPLKIASGFKVEAGSFFQRRGLRRVGIANGGELRVLEVVPKSPAALAGLAEDDAILTFNGQPVFHPKTIEDAIARNPQQPVRLGVKRGETTREVTLTPVKPLKPAEHAPAIGLAYGFHIAEVSDALLRPSPARQIKEAVTIMFRTIKGLATPGSDISFQHLSGPLRIGSIYFRLFELPEGWRLVLWFSVILNVNLAILNLLPFPVLDGGHITMSIIEMIRRRPVLHVKALEVLQTACALLLIGFMLYVTWFDSIDIFGGGSKQADVQPMEFADPAK